MGQPRTRYLASAVFLVALLLAAPPGAAAQVALSLTPVRFELAGYPGQRFSGTVRVINPSEGLAPVVMEVEDFAPAGEEGRVVVGASGDSDRSIKDWIRFDLEEFTVYPKQRLEVGFSVEVPVYTEPGTYFGMILARTASAGAAEPDTLVVAKVGAVVLLDVYGEFREAVHVAGFAAPSFSYGLPVPLSVRFENTGTLREKPTGQIVISNLWGWTVATLPLPEQNVLPGAARRADASITQGLLAGRYTARLEARYGINNGLALEAERSFWFVDLWDVELPVLILAGVFAFIVWKRRNFGAAFRVLRTGEAEIPEPPADSLAENRRSRRMDL